MVPIQKTRSAAGLAAWADERAFEQKMFAPTESGAGRAGSENGCFALRDGGGRARRFLHRERDRHWPDELNDAVQNLVEAERGDPAWQSEWELYVVLVPIVIFIDEIRRTRTRRLCRQRCP